MALKKTGGKVKFQ